MDPFCYLCLTSVLILLSVLSVHCSLIITCWEKTDLLALLCVMIPCVFVTFSYGVSTQVWQLIVPIPDLCDLCLLSFYDSS